MKKNQSSKITFSITFILFFILNISSQSNNPAQSEIWTQPLRQCWEFSSEKIIGSQIASDNAQTFIPTISGEIIAVNTNDGKPLWTSKLGGEITSNIIANDGDLYLLNKIEKPIEKSSEANETEASAEKKQTSTYLRSIDATSGITNWSRSFNLSSKANLFTWVGLLILVAENGYLTALNQKDGTMVWELNTKSEILTTSQPTETIALGTSDKKILIVSSIEGLITKELNIKEIPVNIFLSNNEQLFLGDKKGFLNSLNVSSGVTHWKRRFGGNITNIVNTPRGLFVSSIDNFIYIINKDTGKIVWKRRLAGKVTEKPFIRDNMAISFAFGDSSALFIELNKGKVVNSLTLSDANYFISSPFYSGNILAFPTLKGLVAFGSYCEKKERSGK